MSSVPGMNAGMSSSAPGVRLPAKRLDPDAPLPRHQRAGDAGVDLTIREDVSLGPGERAVVGTGIAVAIPEGFVGLVTPRSGLAARIGLSLVNAPGVVDAGYRGEVRLVLVNLDPSDAVALTRGERVAQMLLVPVARVDAVEVWELPPSERGAGGFGSTGI